jgi:8-oxo-dGTP pyrophosphatase MutT (NUDIX family)
VTTPRDAATVMVVRDCDDALEVLLLRRHAELVFAAGAHVFPGGAVDDADHAPELAAMSTGLPMPPGPGLAYAVAAIRECFEESGLLLATTTAGEPVDVDDPERAERLPLARKALEAGEQTMAELCREEGLVLATASLSYAGRWITPEPSPRRYDTRFFVAAAPAAVAAQVAGHDGRETIASEWDRPADALERWGAGSIELIQPTVANLRALAKHDSATSALAAARSGRLAVEGAGDG